MCSLNLLKNPVVNQSLSCLKESIGDFRNTYTTALMAYVFTLAGDIETRGLLLDHLDTVAIKEGELSSCRKPFGLRYCDCNLHCVCLWTAVFRGVLPLVSDSSKILSLSVCGDQLLCADGQTGHLPD